MRQFCGIFMTKLKESNIDHNMVCVNYSSSCGRSYGGIIIPP